MAYPTASPASVSTTDLEYCSNPVLPAPAVLSGLAPSVPEPVRKLMDDGAALAVQVSGGKDSQAMLWLLAELCRENGWENQIYALHADLGGAEWPTAGQHVEAMCEAADVPLVTVKREKGGLTERIRERMETVDEGTPFWPSSGSRYCTSDLKRGPANKEMRRHRAVIVAMGLRAEESKAREQREPLSVRQGLTTKRFKKARPALALHQWSRLQRLEAAGYTAGMSYGYPDGEGRYRGSGIGGRLALEWLPILHLGERDVWRACGTTLEDVDRRRELTRQGREREAIDGFAAHRSYALGNDRCSCSTCILGSKNDLINGALRNPETFNEWREIERESGIDFRQDLSLEEIGEAAERIRRGEAVLPRFRQPTLF